MMRRRAILRIAAASALSPLVSGVLVSDARAALDPPPLPNPHMTGLLAAAEVETLYAIASHIGTQWKIAAGPQWSRSTFAHILAAKSAAEPSYRTVYAMAVEAFHELAASLGSRDAALDHLYLPDPAWRPSAWGIVRHWVIREFLVLYVTMGAFAAYGWKNFPGFAGGPCDDPAALPYRPSNVG